MHVVAVFTLGLGCRVAWMVYVGRDYEATIACGYALLFAGLYCLARGSLTASSPIFLALGGLALGLAVAARPSLVIAGVFVALAAVLVLRAPHSVRRRGSLLVALLAPYSAVGTLVLLYDQARFGSFFEFGQRYELEFAPLLVLASLLGWIEWSRSRPGTAITGLGNALWLVAPVMSVMFNLAITSTPCAGTGSC